MPHGRKDPNYSSASPSEHSELSVQLPKGCVAKLEPSAFPGGDNPNVIMLEKGSQEGEFLRQREESALQLK